MGIFISSSVRSQHRGYWNKSTTDLSNYNGLVDVSVSKICNLLRHFISGTEYPASMNPYKKTKFHMY